MYGKKTKPLKKKMTKPKKKKGKGYGSKAKKG